VKPVLLDTGVIVALFDRDEKFHGICVEAVEGLAAPLITCEAVLAETCHLLRAFRGVSEAVIENVEAGIFQVPFQISNSATGLKRTLKKYQDRQIDLADACLVEMANEYETGDILTLDNDFRIYRWGKNKVFNILPKDR